MRYCSPTIVPASSTGRGSSALPVESRPLGPIASVDGGAPHVGTSPDGADGLRPGKPGTHVVSSGPLPPIAG